MMNNEKNRKIPLMIYPCIVGFCLFLTSAIVGCFVTQSGVSFIILAGFAVFVLLSFIQIKILDKTQSIRETVFVFNLLLFIKTAVIFCMFLFWRSVRKYSLRRFRSHFSRLPAVRLRFVFNCEFLFRENLFD